jgi:tRNA pseudouridine55 synthase
VDTQRDPGPPLAAAVLSARSQAKVALRMPTFEVKTIKEKRSIDDRKNPSARRGNPGRERVMQVSGEQGAKHQRERRNVHGWLVLDKPVGMTSTHAVSLVKRAFAAKKAGHAGTLDPLASGVLPIALGEATKTVSFVMEGRKTYRFTVRWGAETDTDDAEGRVIARSDVRPTAAEIRAVLPRFKGRLMQTPPRFSAVKVGGERAYDLAREGEEVNLDPRPVEVEQLELLSQPDADHAEFTAQCGKGMYVRALARDLGRALGSLGHVAALRRTAVGPFNEEEAVSLEQLRQAPPMGAGMAGAPLQLLLPVEAALAQLPTLAVNRSDAGRLVRGQAVLLRGRDAPVMAGWVAVRAQGCLIALAEVERGELRPRRIFNLGGA